MARPRIYTEEERKLRNNAAKYKWARNNPNKVKLCYKNWLIKSGYHSNPEFSRKWRRNNPNYWKNRFKEKPDEHKKYLTRMTLNNAVLSGKITRQFCEIDGCQKIGEAHHDDYNKPLDVKWLCKLHHEEYHHHKVLA